MTRKWFDSHLDLAYLGVSGRDMTAQPSQAGGPDLPAAVTFSSLREGCVRAALGTVFIEPTEAGKVAGGTIVGAGYVAGDVESASRAARAQIELYHAWAREGLMRVGFGGEAAGGGDALRVGVLVEGADGVRSPDELEWWVERGVVAIGLTWARASRYATGNATDPSDDPGLSDLGRAMVRAMDQVRTGAGRSVVHDASHLSDRSLRELFDATDRVVVASHSNARAVVARKALEGNATLADIRHKSNAAEIVLQRHLSDDAIKEIARRGGIVGLNVYSPFVIPGGSRERRATVEEWCEHADHVVQVVGHHRAIGIGTDMDGGFSAERLPVGMSQPRDLELLAQGLVKRGWSESAVAALVWGNWARFWGIGAGEDGT